MIPRPRLTSTNPAPRERRAANPDYALGSEPQVHWMNAAFLGALHAVGAIGLAYYLSQGTIEWTHLLVCALGFFLTTFGISTGYHRLFAHRSFQTGSLLRVLLLMLGAAALQNSAVEWASNHRRHHRYMDTPQDPYNARRGLWFSHVGWVLQQSSHGLDDVDDLLEERWAAWQHRWYVPLGLGLGLGLPWLLGMVLWEDGFAGLLFGGVCRLLVSYHATFSINSLAHWLGTQPYKDEGTARDSWLTAVATMGEGYHNYHHTFPGDYRNGVRFYDFDPPKWALWCLARLGLVWGLNRTPGPVIALRRLRKDRSVLERLSTPGLDKAPFYQSLTELRSKLKEWAAVPSINALQVRAAREEFWRSYQGFRQRMARVVYDLDAPLGVSS